MARPKAASSRLEAAQAALDEANHQLANLETKRNALLLKDDDAAAAKLANEIKQQRELADGYADKIKLLQAEAEREANARRTREQEALIGRVEKKFAERDRIGAELADLIPQLNTRFRRMIELGREIAAAWPWPVGDALSLAIGRDQITNAISHELFRQTATPMLGGGMDVGRPNAGLRFPGSKSPSFAEINLPESVMPLTDVLRLASEHGSNVMRGRTTVAAVSVPGPTNGHASERPRSPATIRLAELLKRQAELAALPTMTASDDMAYAEVVQQISIAQSELEAEKQHV